MGQHPGMVISHREDGNIIEQRQQNDHQRRNGIKIKNQNGQRHEQHNTDGLGNAQSGVALHPFKGNPRLLDRLVNHRQTGGGQNNVGSSPGSIRSVGDRKTAVRFFQGGSIIHTIPGHSHDMSAFLQSRHDPIFILRHHLRKNIYSLNHFHDDRFVGM